MVTPLIHSDSRCSVAGLPCTPTLATRPDQLGALLEGLRDPDRLHRHVGAKTVGQPVDLGTGLLWCGHDVSAELLGPVAPGRCGSIATIAAGEYSRAPKIAASPTGPAPTMATTSPGWTWPLSTPTS